MLGNVDEGVKNERKRQDGNGVFKGRNDVGFAEVPAGKRGAACTTITHSRVAEWRVADGRQCQMVSRLRHSWLSGIEQSAGNVARWWLPTPECKFANKKNYREKKKVISPVAI